MNCVHIQCIWQIFLSKAALAAIYLSGTFIISGGHLRLFSRVLCFFEISSCNHQCFQRYRVNAPFYTTKNTLISPNFLVWKLCGNCAFLQNFHSRKLGEITVFFAVPVAVINSTNGPFSIIKEQFEPHVFPNLLYFFRTGGVVAKRYHNINYDTSLVSGMDKLKYRLLFDNISCNNPFLLSVIISPEYLKRSIMLRALYSFHNTYYNNPLWQAVCAWLEKSWRVLCLFDENHCNPVPLNLPIHSTEHSNNFCFYPSHSFIVNVLIWKIPNSNCSYSLSIANFLEEQL